MRSACLLSLALLLCASRPVSAVERDGSIGISVLTPLELSPGVKRGDFTYGIDLGYFLEEQWAGVLSWDFGLGGEKRVGLAVGPQMFLFPDTVVTPYLTGKFLYALDPRNDLGWRFNAGLEWNLAAVTGIDNLRFYAETGISQIFRKGRGDLLLYEIARLGFSWNF